MIILNCKCTTNIRHGIYYYEMLEDGYKTKKLSTRCNNFTNVTRSDVTANTELQLLNQRAQVLFNSKIGKLETDVYFENGSITRQ